MSIAPPIESVTEIKIKKFRLWVPLTKGAPINESARSGRLLKIPRINWFGVLLVFRIFIFLVNISVVMIRAILLILGLFSCMQLAYATTPTDSLNAQMKELQGLVKKQAESLKRQNDSLQREILLYKVKEDFYTESLGGQTAIFSLITGALLTFAGFISWKFVSDRIQNVKRELSNEIDSVEKNLAEKEENDIIIRYQTLRSQFDLGYITLKPLIENTDELGIGATVGVTLGVVVLNQAN